MPRHTAGVVRQPEDHTDFTDSLLVVCVCATNITLGKELRWDVFLNNNKDRYGQGQEKNINIRNWLSTESPDTLHFTETDHSFKMASSSIRRCVSV